MQLRTKWYFDAKATSCWRHKEELPAKKISVPPRLTMPQSGHILDSGHISVQSFPLRIRPQVQTLSTLFAKLCRKLAILKMLTQVILWLCIRKSCLDSFQFYVSLWQAVGNTDSPCFVLRKKDQTKKMLTHNSTPDVMIWPQVEIFTPEKYSPLK